jgi:hypothetical protein
MKSGYPRFHELGLPVVVHLRSVSVPENLTVYLHSLSLCGELTTLAKRDFDFKSIAHTGPVLQ